MNSTAKAAGGFIVQNHFHKKICKMVIYKASRKIKKMQKLSSNILSSWYEDTQKTSD